ncbi:Hypothetical predicted protein [Octopus vulgaris]|uniref:Uncharacterized protein n=1 Tax=Octopus vulgaris TaxID=6645 RepID=A0AA36FJ59_OCTVU|nr:Hypothetical predicted protein [Octopus vulgaris]
MEQENRYKQRKPFPLMIKAETQGEDVKLKDNDTSNSLPLSEILESKSANLSIPRSPHQKSSFTFDFPVETTSQ